MSNYKITDKEQRVLTLASRGESRGGNNYDAVINDNDTYKGILTTMTLTQVRDLQVNKLPSTGAVGRYQLIRRYYPNFVGDARYAGFSPEEQSRLKFSPDIQDYIILKIMKADYKLDDWLAEKISSEEFQFQMSRLFASVPVPRDMKGHNRFVKKGESYYAGDGINAAKGTAESFLAELEAIRKGVDYVAKEVDTATTGESGADPEQGVSNKRVAETATAGGNRPTGGHKTISDPNVQISLPTPSNVYEDEPIDPHDNRYDFRTGKMVRDIGINGTYPVASNPKYSDRQYQSPGVASGADITGTVSDSAVESGKTVTGANPLTDDQQAYSSSAGKITDTSNPDYYDPRLGNVSSSATTKPNNIPSGVSGGRGMPATAPPTNGPLTGGTTTNSNERKTIPPAPAKYIGPF